MQELIDSLKKGNMNGYLVSDKDEALNKALELIPVNSSVGFGGSVTLEQIGILDALRERKDVELLDRTKVKDSKQLYELYARMFSCDVFLSGSNAITEKGQIVNVDGRGNRVAAITFGPKKVIIVVGKNKITSDLDAAVERIRKVACPLNVKRLKELAKSSPVASTIEITEEKIWGQVSIIERQLDEDRIHVVIVNENLGF
ncbi:MAG: lactate utilization protein [Candidatus Zixiibacteriota bacterium]|nr:MAG: lactate utilization protein [candidate division Zixibacteria bacterium]